MLHLKLVTVMFIHFESLFSNLPVSVNQCLLPDVNVEHVSILLTLFIVVFVKS